MQSLTNIKAIIFDMDGTLIDSLSVWEDSDRTFIEGLGYEYSREHSLAMKFMHFDSACDYIKETYSLELSSEEIGEQILQIVKDKYINQVPLKDGVINFLTSAKAHGIRMCVATSNKKALADATLKSHGLDPFMDFTLTSDEVGCGKESPLIFEKAAEMLGTAPTETAVFEDSIHAVRSAKSAGFRVVGVRDCQDIREFHEIEKESDFTIRSFEEIRF